MSAPNLSASDVDPSAFPKAGPWSTQARVTVSAAYFNRPVEVAELRARRDLKTAPFPQLGLRIGRGPDISPSRRRQLSHVCA